MIILCGLCGGGKHEACSGFLRTDAGFCGCFVRGHDLHAEPVSLDRQLAQLAIVNPRTNDCHPTNNTEKHS